MTKTPDAAFRAGQSVRITTLNQGRRPTAMNRQPPPKVEVWTAIIVGPSALGDDLWMVKKSGGAGRAGGLYTVPAHEITSARKG
jgi:hypothetical protein